ncbi:MAG: MFS transporter [Bacteroidota bacterium]
MYKKRLSKWTLTAYAAPVVATSIMHMPSVYIIPAFYAKYTEVSLAAIATVLLFGRIFDAISDPLIGFLSDRTRSRFGKRKPWMMFGTPIAMVAIIFVFMPPANAGIFYFAFWSIAMFFSWTLIDVPQLAWGSELSRDYNERSRIMTARVVAMNIGAVLFMAAPILLQPYTGTTEIGPLVMKIAGWTVAISLPILMFFTLRYVPVGKQVSTHVVNLWDFVKSVKVNKPFVRFTFATIFDWIGIGIWLGTFYIFTDTYMGIGDKFPYLLLIAWLTRVLTAPLWVRFMNYFGKHKVWAASTLLDIAIVPLALFIEPGPSAFVPMLIYVLILGFIQSGTAYAPPAIYGDVIDYDTLKTGSNKAGSFFAIYGLITKAAMAIGGSIAFYLMSVFEFDVSGGNSEHQNIGLFLAYAFIPLVLRIVTMLTVWNFPIDARRQGIIKRRIESRVKLGNENK